MEHYNVQQQQKTTIVFICDESKLFNKDSINIKKLQS